MIRWVLVFVLLLGGVGCRGEARILPDDVFAFALGSDPETFDPGVMTGSVEGRIAMQIYEGLYLPARRDGEAPRPGVALRHEVSSDGKTWTFYLRENARWSNGDPVTAHDFEFAWKRLLQGDVAAYYVSFLRYLRNGRAVELGEMPVEEAGVRALSDHVLRVELQQPIPYFLEVVAFFTLLPVHRGSIEQHGQEGAFRADRLVTNGPFRIVEYRRRNVIRMEPNPYHWEAGRMPFREVRALIIEDQSAKVTAFNDGRVDWIDELPDNQVATLRIRPEFRSANLLGTYYFRFNVTRPPFDDPRVRHAFSLAVNREELCRCTLDDLYTPAQSFVPPMPVHRSPSDLVGYDPDRARALLAEAGFPGGQGIRRLTLLYNTSENHRVIAQALQDMWSTELGVQVELLNQEWKVYLDSTRDLDFDLARAGWIGDYQDANTFLEMWKTGDANNNTGWGDEAYDSLILRSLGELDVEARQAMLTEAERMLLEAAPIIPLFHYTQKHLVRSNVRGWELNTMSNYLIRDWHKDSTAEEAP